MKPYKDSTKFIWVCPVCFDEKTAGGNGHIRAQANGHMRKEHGVYEFSFLYVDIGRSIGNMIRDGSITKEQMESLRETKERT